MFVRLIQRGSTIFLFTNVPRQCGEHLGPTLQRSSKAHTSLQDLPRESCPFLFEYCVLLRLPSPVLIDLSKDNTDEVWDDVLDFDSNLAPTQSRGNSFGNYSRLTSRGQSVLDLSDSLETEAAQPQQPPPSYMLSGDDDYVEENQEFR